MCVGFDQNPAAHCVLATSRCVTVPATSFSPHVAYEPYYVLVISQALDLHVTWRYVEKKKRESYTAASFSSDSSPNVGGKFSSQGADQGGGHFKLRLKSHNPTGTFVPEKRSNKNIPQCTADTRELRRPLQISAVRTSSWRHTTGLGPELNARPLDTDYDIKTYKVSEKCRENPTRAKRQRRNFVFIIYNKHSAIPPLR